MKYICAQPALPYFYWQIRTMLFSFKTNSVSLEDVHVVLGTYGPVPQIFEQLQAEYPAVTFAYYIDDRNVKSYHPSIKPYLMHKHYQANSYLEQEKVFYHDCDIVLTKPLDFSLMLTNDIIYLSDTVSYIGHDYIISKGHDVLEKMCAILNIDPAVVQSNQHNSGGAQYLLKNITVDYWQDVYQDSEKLYFDMTEYITTCSQNIHKQNNNNDYTLQIWCAEMWATLWNLWKRDLKTTIHSDLEFSWATSPVSLWENHSIYHNAGVVSAQSGLFYKGDYVNTMPYNLSLEIDPSKASSRYYTLVQASNVII